MLTKLIKKADLLVDPYEFNISEKEKSLTSIGGLISILLLIFTGFYLYSVFQRGIQNENEIYAGTQSDSYGSIILNNDNIFFALELAYLNGTTLNIDPEIWSYFTLTAQFVQQYRVEGQQGFTRNRQVLNQTRCSNNVVDQFNFNSASMTKEEKAQLICFDGNFTLSGQFYEPKFSYVKLGLSVCNIQNNCKQIEEISDFINQGINFNLFIQGSKIKQDLNQTDPAEKFATNIFWKLNTGIGNNEDIYIQPLQMDLKRIEFFQELLNTDNSQMLYNGTVVQKQERRQEPTSVQYGQELCTFYLRGSSEIQYFFVLQQDLPSIVLSSISEATALFFAVMQIIKIFYRVYNQHKTLEVLMNSVFRFDVRSVQIRKLSQGNSQLIGNMSTTTPKSNNRKLQQFLDYTINYQFYKYLKYQFTRCFKTSLKNENERELIISQIAKSKIEFDLDLTNILKKLYEIDCLKLFLFDDDQLLLFNTFCAPVFQDKIVTQQKEIFEMMKCQKQNRSINPQERLNTKSINTSQRENQQIYNQAQISAIPINIRLASISRFFLAQLAAQNANDLVQSFKSIKEMRNKNNDSNRKLMEFIAQNRSLFDLVQQNLNNLADQENQQIIQEFAILEVPNEIVIDSHNNNATIAGNQGNTIRDLTVNVSAPSLNNRLRQN